MRGSHGGRSGEPRREETIIRRRRLHGAMAEDGRRRIIGGIFPLPVPRGAPHPALDRPAVVVQWLIGGFLPFEMELQDAPAIGLGDRNQVVSDPDLFTLLR